MYVTQGFFLYADAKTQITGNSRNSDNFAKLRYFFPKLRSENGKTQILRHFDCVSIEMILWLHQNSPNFRQKSPKVIKKPKLRSKLTKKTQVEIFRTRIKIIKTQIKISKTQIKISKTQILRHFNGVECRGKCTKIAPDEDVLIAAFKSTGYFFSHFNFAGSAVLFKKVKFKCTNL